METSLQISETYSYGTVVIEIINRVIPFFTYVRGTLSDCKKNKKAKSKTREKRFAKISDIIIMSSSLVLHVRFGVHAFASVLCRKRTSQPVKFCLLDFNSPN